jgi:serine/threonine protein phosphatase PrpC
VKIGRAAGLTDTGRRRLQNEDAFVCEPPLFAVADGMGGAQAGELASSLAAAAIEERAAGLRGEEAVAALVREANARIFEHALTDPSAAGMGTTTTLALVDEQASTLTLGHVGDSRAYLFRDGLLEQITTDHSLVGELIRSGRLTEEEAAVHPHRSVITRALGTDATVQVDTQTIPIAEGDVVLLCSDGLSSMLPATRIAELAVEDSSPDALCERLVAAANSAGGEDNITVVAFELTEGDPPERPAKPPPAAVAETPVSQAPVASSQPSSRERGKGIRRHGAGDGSRWPALLFLLAVLLIGALALWWGITR